jgi:hypothetical protein
MTNATIPSQIHVPLAIAIRRASDNTVLYQEHQTFTIETDPFATLIERTVQQSGRPAVEILEELVFKTIQNELKDDVALQEIVRGMADKVRLTMTFAGITYS